MGKKEQEELFKQIKDTLKQKNYLIYLVVKDEKGLDFQLWNRGFGYPEMMGLFEVQKDMAKQKLCEWLYVPKSKEEQKEVEHRKEVT